MPKSRVQGKIQEAPVKSKRQFGVERLNFFFYYHRWATVITWDLVWQSDLEQHFLGQIHYIS